MKDPLNEPPTILRMVWPYRQVRKTGLKNRKEKINAVFRSLLEYIDGMVFIKPGDSWQIPGMDIIMEWSSDKNPGSVVCIENATGNIIHSDKLFKVYRAVGIYLLVWILLYYELDDRVTCDTQAFLVLCDNGFAVFDKKQFLTDFIDVLGMKNVKANVTRCQNISSLLKTVRKP